MTARAELRLTIVGDRRSASIEISSLDTAVDVDDAITQLATLTNVAHVFLPAVAPGTGSEDPEEDLDSPVPGDHTPNGEVA